MGHVNESIYIAAPLSEVLSYTSDIKNWNQWLYNMKIENTSEENRVRPGTIIDWESRMLGTTNHGQMEILENNVTNKSAYMKLKLSGRIEGEETNTYLEEENGTRVIFETNYTVPGGRVFDRLLGGRAYRKMQAKSLMNLKYHFESVQ